MNLSSLLGIQNPNPSTGSVQSGGTGSSSGAPPQADIGSMQTGQTIQGTVVSVKGNEVVLSLENGSQLNARLDKGIPVAEGQVMTFEVKSNAGNRLALSPLFENMGHDPNALKALTAAGMPSTANNINMVTLMMREGLPVNRNSLQEFGRQMALHPTADPMSLVQMNRLQIPATPENIAQFEAYKNYEHQISQSVLEIADGLTDTFSQMMQSGDVKGAVNLFQEVLSLFTEEGLAKPEQGAQGMGAEQTAGRAQETGVEQASVQGTGRAQGSGVELAASAEGKVVVIDPGQAGNKVAAQSDLSGILLNEIPGKTAETATDQGQNIQQGGAFGTNAEVMPGSLQGEIPETAAGSRQGDLSGMIPDSLQKDAAAAVINNEAEQVFNDGAKTQVLLEMNVEDRAQLAGKLTEAGFPDTLTGIVSSGNITQTALLQAIAKMISEHPENFDLQKLAQVFGSKEYSTILKNEIGRQWLLRPEEVAGDRQVEELYRRLNEQTNKLTNALAHVSRADSPVAQAANNLSNNLNFVNQLNQMFTYIQLPLKMNGENTHGELYVYTNKKNLAKQDGNVSALLHLDMEHLGPVDVYVAMQNQSVSTKFYLRDDSTIDFVGKHIHILSDRLSKRGYSMSCEFIPKNETKTPMEEMMEANKNVSVVASYSFDARA